MINRVTNSPSAPRTWRLRACQHLRRRGWDDEYVIYNDWSGDTHLIGPAALHTLLALQAGECDESFLDASLRHAFALDEDDDAGLSALLDELAGLGLIEALPC